VNSKSNVKQTNNKQYPIIAVDDGLMINKYFSVWLLNRSSRLFVLSQNIDKNSISGKCFWSCKSPPAFEFRVLVTCHHFRGW